MWVFVFTILKPYKFEWIRLNFKAKQNYFISLENYDTTAAAAAAHTHKQRGLNLNCSANFKQIVSIIFGL